MLVLQVGQNGYLYNFFLSNLIKFVGSKIIESKYIRITLYEYETFYYYAINDKTEIPAGTTEKIDLGIKLNVPEACMILPPITGNPGVSQYVKFDGSSISYRTSSRISSSLFSGGIIPKF